MVKDIWLTRKTTENNMEKTFFIIYSDVKVRKMFLFTFFTQAYDKPDTIFKNEFSYLVLR